MRKAIQLNPDFADAHSNLGSILKDLGNLQEAKNSYQKAINLNPDFANAHYNLGNVLHDLGNLQEAKVSYRKAIKIKPDYIVAHSNLGNVLRDLGKLQEAELSIRKAIELNPNFPDAHLNLGNILRDHGNLRDAEFAYRRAIQIRPDYTNAHSNLGNVLRDQGNLKDAEFAYRKAIELNPNFAEAHSNLGSILKDLGNLQGAKNSYQKAIDLNPDFANAHSNLGSIMRDLGKLGDAEFSYLKAFDLDPKNKSIKINLISLLTIYEPKDINSNPLYAINEEFKNLSLHRNDNIIITDNEAIQLYKNGLEIYRKYNLDLETSLSQIYQSNEISLNCRRHMLIFNKHKIIPEFCFGCYKVQVEVDSIVELIKLFLVFNALELKNSNTRKCMIEFRTNISGFYKGLIYCLGLNEALDISKQLNIHLRNNIRIDLLSKVKRGCSEYPLEFPKYKEIKISGNQPMNYNENWRSIEKEIDKGKKEWGKSNKSIEGFNLNNFLIMRNWIAYAQKIGDKSVNKITNEQIKAHKSFNTINRKYNSKKK
tara:strand:+ start:2 stop:1615 length:1614 start_codon:yes stop_codon:yes gene_type:complete